MARMYENAGKNIEGFNPTLYRNSIVASRYALPKTVESNFDKIFKFRLRPLNLQNHLVKPDANNWFSS